jgi:hypothetical protein
MKKHSMDIHFFLFVLMIILIMTFISGCSISRKMNKEHSITQESGKVSTDTKTSLTDKSTTRITEHTNDTVKTPGVNIQGESLGTYLQTVVNGDTLFAKYEPKTNTITAEYIGTPKKVPVKSTKTTEINNNIQKEESKKSDSSYKNKEDNLSKQVDQKTAPSFVFWFLGGLVILVIAFGIYKSGILKKIIKPNQ